MNTIDLTALEDSSLDFKLILPETEQLAKLMVAMANCKGGKIIIGVREASQKRGDIKPDKRIVEGIIPNQRQEEHIANVASEVCTPVVSYNLSYLTYSKKTIMIIDVEAGNAKPYYVKKLGINSGAYIRVGSTTRLADSDTLKKLVRDGQNISFDSEQSSLSRSDLSDLLFETYLEKRAQKLSISNPRDKAALLENVKAINAQSNKLTIAGALIFSDTPQIDPQLSNAIVRAARFKGKHGGDFIDQAEISGDLMHQIENAVKFVVKNITLSSSSAGLQRQDSYQFPLKVIREVITNAIIHRDYSVKNENIKIAIYDDRLEVTSPGGLPGTVTVENIISMQHSRNPIISKIMFETGYLEAWGLGIDSIIEWCEKSGNIPPVFIDDGIQFKVSIFSVRRKEAKTKSENLTQREKFILELISKHALLNNGTIREKSNLSKTQTHSALTKLLKLKLISRNGKGPATTYKVR